MQMPGYTRSRSLKPPSAVEVFETLWQSGVVFGYTFIREIHRNRKTKGENKDGRSFQMGKHKT